MLAPFSSIWCTSHHFRSLLVYTWSRSYSTDPPTFSLADLCASGSHWGVRHSLQEGKMTFCIKTCRQGCSPSPDVFLLMARAGGQGGPARIPQCLEQRGSHFSHCQARQRALCQSYLGQGPRESASHQTGTKTGLNCHSILLNVSWICEGNELDPWEPGFPLSCITGALKVRDMAGREKGPECSAEELLFAFLPSLAVLLINRIICLYSYSNFLYKWGKSRMDVSYLHVC